MKRMYNSLSQEPANLSSPMPPETLHLSTIPLSASVAFHLPISLELLDTNVTRINFCLSVDFVKSTVETPYMKEGKHKKEMEDSSAQTQESSETLTSLEEMELTMVPTQEVHEIEQAVQSIEKSSIVGQKCQYCAKTCANSGSLKLHIRYKHKKELEDSSAETLKSAEDFGG